MFEQFLSILLTSDHLTRSEFSFETKSPLDKGIYPGTRLGLHRISHSSNKPTSHYRPGDLGLIPSSQN